MTRAGFHFILWLQKRLISAKAVLNSLNRACCSPHSKPFWYSIISISFSRRQPCSFSKYGLAVVILSVFSGYTFASTSVDGYFKTLKSCPAYLSKNKKTNPDQLTVPANEQYELVEINRAGQPDWFRIVIPDNAHTLRWVARDCGQANYRSTDHSHCDQTPGMADAYVLALSWQPAFCQTYGYEIGKPECLKLQTDSYASSHMVLHGLWPNQDNCGTNYGFCGVESLSHHCDYPSLTISKPIADKLRILMPSFAYGSCLERHEWQKHGSCQILSQDDYFSLALRLTEEADKTELGQYLYQHRGDHVPRKQLEDMVARSFGKEAVAKVYLGCKDGFLVDVFIQLPPLIPYTTPLAELVRKAPERRSHQGCPTTVGISDFHAGS
ncbi:ribonuclease T2 family protein [Legionella spiritensis]|uniref:ribonuclease T2 family protein n=1 Tax=Legionella spiritensis TaxID=452 RepID=UPI000F6E69B5|nr:ribonuclease T [Legionella spiritensis]VEG91467.1 ribonuclease, T2 family [Legionella spiritensis]